MHMSLSGINNQTLKIKIENDLNFVKNFPHSDDQIAAKINEIKSFKVLDKGPLLIESAEVFRSEAPHASNSDSVTKKLAPWNNMIRWIISNHNEVVYLTDITATVATEYFNILKKSGNISAGYYNKSLNEIKSVWANLIYLYPEAFNEKPFEKIETLNLNLVKNRQKVIRPLLNEEVLAIVKELETQNSVWKQAFTIALYTGITQKGICLLKKKDILFGENLIKRKPEKDTNQKKLKKRQVYRPVDPDLIAFIKEITDSLNDDDFLFPTLATKIQDIAKPVPRFWSKLFKKLSILGDDEYNVNFQSIREWIDYNMWVKGYSHEVREHALGKRPENRDKIFERIRQRTTA